MKKKYVFVNLPTGFGKSIILNPAAVVAELPLAEGSRAELRTLGKFDNHRSRKISLSYDCSWVRSYVRR